MTSIMLTSFSSFTKGWSRIEVSMNLSHVVLAQNNVTQIHTDFIPTPPFSKTSNFWPLFSNKLQLGYVALTQPGHSCC